MEKMKCELGRLKARGAEERGTRRLKARGGRKKDTLSLNLAS
mgnify:CR=1 FL=1